RRPSRSICRATGNTSSRTATRPASSRRPPSPAPTGRHRSGFAVRWPCKLHSGILSEHHRLRLWTIRKHHHPPILERPLMGIITIQRAVRAGCHLLISLAGPSGSGKTMSAILLARGLVGPSEKIGFLDTETGRGRLYADIAGGFDYA